MEHRTSYRPANGQPRMLLLAAALALATLAPVALLTT